MANSVLAPQATSDDDLNDVVKILGSTRMLACNTDQVYVAEGTLVLKHADGGHVTGVIRIAQDGDHYEFAPGVIK